MRLLLKKLYFILFKKSVSFVHYAYNKKSQQYYYYFLSKNRIVFLGKPKFIGLSSTFDNHGTITLEKNIVISEEVVFLTHDYSVVNIGQEYLPNISGYPWVGDIHIGENTFIGIRSHHSSRNFDLGKIVLLVQVLSSKALSQMIQ